MAANPQQLQHPQKPQPKVPQNQSTPGAKQEAAWGEDDLEEALEHLKILHIKCRGLRTTIPRMLESVAAKQTPQEVLKGFTTSVNSAGGEIKDFSNLYNNPESKKVLEYAKKSRERNPDGIKPWKHPDQPNWFFADESDED